jgi:hemolysin activation/secretion protein
LSFAAQAQEAKHFVIHGYVIEGNTLLSTQQLQDTVRPHTGPDRTLADIQLAAQAARNAYDNAGFPVVRVFAPAQTSENGYIVLQVIEAEIRSVDIRDNQHHSNEMIRRSLPSVQTGIKPNTHTLLRDLATANENPSRHATVNLQSTESSGYVDAVVRVRDEYPSKLTLSLDNTGNSRTGHNRLTFGARKSNLFERDHVASLQLLTHDKPASGYSASAAYRIPFYGQARWLEIRAVYSDASSTLNVGPGDVRFTGRGQLLGLGLSQNLVPVGQYSHKLQTGLDSKTYRNRCDGLLVGDCGSVTALPITLAYAANWLDSLKQVNGQISFSRNLPALGADPGASYESLNAERNWSVWRATSTYLQKYPGDIQLQMGITGQYTRDRLIPSEQAGVGGVNTIRGYAERSLSGSRALTISTQVVSPQWGRQWHDALEYRALLFLDAGQTGAVNRNGSQDQSEWIASTGLGLRVQWGRNLSFSADWGIALKPLRNTALSEQTRERGDGFAHIGMTVQY